MALTWNARGSHSITYRIAVGPQAGRKAFTLQTVPAREQDHDHPNLAKTAGFSLHAGVAAKAHQRRKLERLCRYIARPAVAIDRLALTPQGNVRYTLKTPCRDGTTHIILEPLDCIARLAVLVPKPRVNLTRFHGVFAPNSALRHHVTPAGRGKRKPIEDSALVKRVLDHLEQRPESNATPASSARAPPAAAQRDGS